MEKITIKEQKQDFVNLILDYKSLSNVELEKRIELEREVKVTDIVDITDLAYLLKFTLVEKAILHALAMRISFFSKDEVDFIDTIAELDLTEVQRVYLVIYIERSKNNS